MTLGIDIGATKIRAGLVDGRGRILSGTPAQHLTDRRPAAVLESVGELVRAHLDVRANPPEAVGVALAAQVDRVRGSVLYAPNLRWRDVAVAGALAKLFGLSVTLENDVRASTLAEWQTGAARGCSQVALFWGGTGLGGGLVVDGRLLGGARGAAGELGHLTVVAEGRPCHCPNRGCLEAYVGGWAIAERAQEAIREDPAAGKALVEMAGRRAAVDASVVFAVAEEGDPLAHRLVAETESALAAGAVTVANALNPELLLLGGPVLVHWEGIAGRIERAVRSRCQPPAAERVRVRLAALGDWAPVIGAGLRARDLLSSRAPST